MRTYQEAADHLARGRSKTYRPLTGRSTSLERRDADTIAVRYHETDVVTYHAGRLGQPGTVTVNSDGWRTATTKERINTYSHVRLYQEHGLWYVVTGVKDEDGRTRPDWESPRCLYEDGLTAFESGALVNPPDKAEMQRLESAKRKVDKMVREYVKGYIAHLYEVGHIEDPGPGDCWYCLMFDRPEATGTVNHFGVDVVAPPKPKHAHETDHLFAHMREGYYVPSLLYNAAVERGYGGGPGMVRMDDRYFESGQRVSHLMTEDTLRAYFRRQKLPMAQALAATIKRNTTPAVGPGSEGWEQRHGEKVRICPECDAGDPTSVIAYGECEHTSGAAVC